MHAVLKEMGKEGSEAADAAAGVSRLTRLASPAVPPLRTSTPHPTHPTHPTHPHGDRRTPPPPPPSRAAHILRRSTIAPRYEHTHTTHVPSPHRQYPLAARHAAASKLITNHDRVLRDLCRADEAHPTSQPELTRLPGQEAQINVYRAGFEPRTI